MTYEEKAEEGSCEIIIPIATCTTLATTTCTTLATTTCTTLATTVCTTLTTYNPTAYSTPPQPIITFDPQYLVQSQPTPPLLNFSTGQAAFCLDAIVRNKDLMEATECIKNE